MTLAKKKKLARRERQEQLKEREKLIQARLRQVEDGKEEEVKYVLPEDETNDNEDNNSGYALSSSLTRNEESTSNTLNINNSVDEDRVQLPSVSVGVSSVVKSGRRREKIPWESLKLAVAERFGPEVSSLVEEHDGNAEDPYFTVLLKSLRRTVPVPRHWSRLRAFLVNQADREQARDIVPAEIAALGVERIRAARDKRANPDQIAFVSCFITGTPLQRRRFRVGLTRFGDIFYEGRWLPRALHEPGLLSSRLRAALGMGPHAPPPWLRGMQEMRRLPPAYPTLRVPGLNAPIPPGAQWGDGEGQWGRPPRNENNTFVFPGVMEEVAVEEAPHVYWGTVPPLDIIEEKGQEHSGLQPSSSSTTSQTTTNKRINNTQPTGTAKQVITPVPFHPQAYSPANAMKYVPNTPQEYIRVQDNTPGVTVALGSIIVPKNNTNNNPGIIPTQPIPPQQVQEKRPVPPRPATKF